MDGQTNMWVSEGARRTGIRSGIMVCWVMSCGGFCDEQGWRNQHRGLDYGQRQSVPAFVFFLNPLRRPLDWHLDTGITDHLDMGLVIT